MADSNNASSFVILGAAGGIGSETSRRLVARGDRVLLAGRQSSRLTQLAEELDAPQFEIDATSTDEVEAALTSATEQFGSVDGVANCVGSLLLKPAHLTSDDDWDDTIAKNLRTAFATVKAAGTVMRRSGGSIVLVSSAAATLGFPNHEAIAAAKAGILGLTLSAAATYSSYGLRFNAVAPGLVKTPMTEQIWSKESTAQASVEMHAAGRLGEARDVASAIAWLLDSENSWMTGEVIAIDGGLSHVRPAIRRKPS